MDRLRIIQKKCYLAGVETESCSDEEDQNINHRIAQNDCF